MGWGRACPSTCTSSQPRFAGSWRALGARHAPSRRTEDVLNLVAASSALHSDATGTALSSRGQSTRLSRDRRKRTPSETESGSLVIWLASRRGEASRRLEAAQATCREIAPGVLRRRGTL